MIKNTILFILLFIGINSIAQQKSIDSLYEKDSITIVVTDSGLGGLSVVADIEKKMKDSGHFAKIKLIFANALFDENAGYNSLTDRDEKIAIFNKVLKGINKKYNPDLLLIACNTLSVIYQETEFAKQSNATVIGIVDIGVSQMKNALDYNENTTVIIFGTKTTIEEDNYRSDLVDLGIDNQRITSQACPQLQQYIENGPFGDDTEMLIMSYVDEALEKTTFMNDTVFMSLNCTHFGYSKQLWLDAFRFSSENPVEIINPNIKMAEILLIDKFSKKHASTTWQIEVVSKVKLSDMSLKSIAAILKPQSETVSKALENYHIDSNLF